MPQAQSNMLPLGTTAPEFDLPDTVSGKQISYDDLKGEKGLVMLFICNHCPYVIHIQEEIVQIANEFQVKGIGFVAISSNDVSQYHEDHPDLMKIHAQHYAFGFPYLYDESQAVAKAYQASCTPDFMVFDRMDHCVYRGRMDDATPGNGHPVTGADLRLALTNLIENKAIDANQMPSIGCSIKWKD